MRQKLASLDERTLAEQSGLTFAGLLYLDTESLVRLGSAVTAKVLAHPAYQNATRLSVYISMPKGELRTDAIVRHALDQSR